MAATLPLFPLGTVLFPGTRLPLHIFELRYRRLIEDLIRHAHDHPEFGVVAIREGVEVGAHGVTGLYPVGCTAELVGVAPLPDGRYEIMTRGVRRFRVLEVHPTEPDRADRADVEFLTDEPTERSRDLAETATRLFRRYRSAVLTARGFDPESPFTLPDDPVGCSNAIAATVALDLTDRQRLLGAPTVDDRLILTAELLRREIGLIDSLSTRAGEELSRGSYSPN